VNSLWPESVGFGADAPLGRFTRPMTSIVQADGGVVSSMGAGQPQTKPFQGIGDGDMARSPL